MGPINRKSRLGLFVLQTVLFAMVILGLLMLWFFVLLPRFFQ